MLGLANMSGTFGNPCGPAFEYNCYDNIGESQCW